MEKVILQTNLNDIKLLRRGKVRDIYDLGEYLLLVASDRVSAFDVVLPNGIPGKGRILTHISIFWFNEMKDIISNHLIATDVKGFPVVCQKYSDQLEGRSMLVKKSKPLPVECIVRGYLSGSGWKEYKENGTVCGIKLKNGLLESAKLDEPIFTPSTKADEGHDINISFDEAKKILDSKNIGDLSRAVDKVREAKEIVQDAASVSESIDQDAGTIQKQDQDTKGQVPSTSASSTASSLNQEPDAKSSNAPTS